LSSSPDGWREGEIGADAELVQAAFAADEMEAGAIQGLLESSGIPSLLQPTGFNGPNMLGGIAGGAGVVHGRGSQRVMVHAGRLEEAQALLASSLGAEEEEEEWSEIANARHLEGRGERRSRSYGFAGAYARTYLFGIGFFTLAFGIFLLLRAL
jgi:hypothetical protein